MIICKKCGKIKIYKVREIVTREIIYGESGMVHDFKFVSEKEGEPRCVECGRVVKFFKDEESEKNGRIDSSTSKGVAKGN